MGASRPGTSSLILLALLGCGSEPSPSPEAARAEGPATVVLVTLDTTRADRLGAFGGPAGLTPGLDALAASGLVFEQARSTHPITLPAHTSILTGTYPSAHGVRDNGIDKVSPRSLLVSEVLSARGFATGAAVGSFVLDGRFGLDQGFDVYLTPRTRRLGQPLVGADRPADEVVDDALQWLASVDPTRPAFLWAHLFDAHYPYAAPEPYRSAHDDPYDAEVAFADAQVSRLLAGLVAAGRTGPRLVVVVADHGEGLGEHGELLHGVFVYDSTLRVPLIVAGDGVPAGRSRSPVSVADVTPTVLDWLGVPRETMPDVRTPSLLAVAAGRADGDEGRGDERAVPVESLLPWHEHGWHPVRGVIQGGFKYVHTARPELYDLRHDPRELRDLTASRPDVAARLADSLQTLDRLHAALLEDAPASDLGDEERRILASLGYLSASGAAPGGGSLPDAKDRLADLERRNEALFLIWTGRRRMGIDGVLAEAPAAPRNDEERARWLRGREDLGRAQAILAELLVGHAGDPDFLSWMGITELALGQPQAARALFERVVGHRPGSAEARFNLAAACLHDGDPDRARAEMETALRLEPRALRATLWMARWHLEREQPGQAVWWLEQLVGESELPRDDDDEESREVFALLVKARAAAKEAGVVAIPPGPARG